MERELTGLLPQLDQPERALPYRFPLRETRYAPYRVAFNLIGLYHMPVDWVKTTNASESAGLGKG